MMGWSIGYDSTWHRDIGYGVPATCDHPRCEAEIDRGLSYVCGEEPYGGDGGCGLFFCGEHLRGSRIADRGSSSERRVAVCPRCAASKPPYKHPKPDLPEWTLWKWADDSWAEWRAKHPELEAAVAALLATFGVPA
jgi:hypothetical protein